MEQTDQGKFSCDSCHKSYKWKPELAGRKVKWKCGAVMVAPAEPPIAEDNPIDDLYALAEDAKASAHRAAPETEGFRCPSCQSPLAMGAVMCTNCGFNLKTGKRGAPVAAKAAPAGALAVAAVGGGGGRAGAQNPMLGYASTAKKQAGKDDVGDAMATEFYLPIGMILFGFIGQLAQVMYFQRFALPFQYALVYVTVNTVINMTFIAIGCLATIKLMEISFGAPGPALLKLAAIALAPTALANIISYLLKDPIGIVGISIAFGLYYALFYYLFDLDGGEMMVLTMIISAVRFFGTIITVIVLATIIGGVFTGVGGGGGSPAAAGGGGFSSSHDEELSDLLRQPRVKEARLWVNDNGGRVFGGLGHEECVKITDDLYNMGAKDISVEPEGAVAETVVVTLPRDAEQRKKIFVYAKALATKHGIGIDDKDEGYKYLRMYFPHM